MFNIDESSQEIPQEMIDFFTKCEKEKNPHMEDRKGRPSAEATLRTNKVTEPSTIEAVMKTGFDFSEFQETALYHKNGFFNNMGDYQSAMPMLPQLLAPLFGMTMGEFAFAHYVNSCRSPVPPTFISLGAGQGFLDYDLIEHVTSQLFLELSQEFPSHGLAMNKDSKFIISDKGKYSIALLKKELSQLTSNPELSRRIQIEEQDALDLKIKNVPFGIVYANELIDNLATEPIVNINGELYCIKVVAYNLAGIGENTQYAQKINSGVSGISGAISKEQAKARIDTGETTSMGFSPVFVPLSYDSKLSEKAMQLSSLRRINKPEFNGIYPIHLSLDDLFSGIKRSCEQGVVTLIDYFSQDKGKHNWNIAVNHLKHYKYGTEDIDFQIDPAQVIETAEQHGFHCKENSSMRHPLEEMIPLMQVKGIEGIARWAQAQGQPLEEQSILGAMTSYSTLIPMADRYAHMIFHF